MLSSSFPVLDVFWEIFFFFLFFLWIVILFQVLLDLFRSPDLHGLHKALWFIFILFVPFLGVFIYLIARGGKMHEHQAQAVQSQQQAMDDYIKKTAGASTADELAKLHDLKEKGVISDAEYETAKTKLISA